MNNQQLIQIFPRYPIHSIHRVPDGKAFHRWLTMTAQLPSIGGQSWIRIRQNVLNALYEDWERYRAETIQQIT